MAFNYLSGGGNITQKELEMKLKKWSQMKKDAKMKKQISKSGGGNTTNKEKIRMGY